MGCLLRGRLLNVGGDFRKNYQGNQLQRCQLVVELWSTILLVVLANQSISFWLLRLLRNPFQCKRLGLTSDTTHSYIGFSHQNGLE